MRGVTPALCRSEASVLTEESPELVTEAPCIMSHFVKTMRLETGAVRDRSSLVRYQDGTRAR